MALATILPCLFIILYNSLSVPASLIFTAVLGLSNKVIEYSSGIFSSSSSDHAELLKSFPKLDKSRLYTSSKTIGTVTYNVLSAATIVPILISMPWVPTLTSYSPIFFLKSETASISRSILLKLPFALGSVKDTSILVCTGFSAFILLIAVSPISSAMKLRYAVISFVIFAMPFAN